VFICAVAILLSVLYTKQDIYGWYERKRNGEMENLRKGNILLRLFLVSFFLPCAKFHKHFSFKLIQRTHLIKCRYIKLKRQAA
jgi:hypothetical protein